MPPVTNLPYGKAPAYCFPLTELCMYVLFILCLLYAYKKGIRHISYLVAGVLFGLLLEYINVITNMGYVYGRFVVMLGTPPLDIPLWIGVGWGIIMYSVRLFTDAFRLPLWASVSLDALLALSIDVSMDVAAYRLHMWTWNWNGTGLNPLTAQWFGIPYGNFSGWLYVVFFYSSFSRLLERWLTKNNKAVTLKLAVIPLLSVLASQVALYVMLVYVGDFLRSNGITDGTRLSYTLIILALVVIFGWQKRLRSSSSALPFVTWLGTGMVSSVFFYLAFYWRLLQGDLLDCNSRRFKPGCRYGHTFSVHLFKTTGTRQARVGG